MGSVVVIGAGIAGLTCAWRLQERGHDVEVLEREATPGGRMRSEPLGDFSVDRGAQFVSSGYRNLHGVVHELGLADRVRGLAEPRNAILRGGVLHPGDYDSPAAFVASRLLSWPSRLRLPRVLWPLLRHRLQLDPLHPELAAPLDTRDLATWLRRTAGDEAEAYLFGPAFSATFDSEPEDLSAVFGMLMLRWLLRGFRLQAFAGGTGLLTRTLAERLPVRTGCEVRSVETEADGAVVRYRVGARSGRALADAVVVAVPGAAVAGICPKLTPAERSFFEHVHYGRGAIVHLALEEPPATLPYYGVAFPRPEGIGLYGLAVDHHKPGVAPPGAGLLNVALTEAAARALWDAPDERVVAHAVGELARTPIGRLAPVAAAVHRWSPMIPQFRTGYTRALRAFLTRADRSPRLLFAGDYLVGATTESALTSGLRAADAAAALLA